MLGFFCQTMNGYDGSLFGGLLANKTFLAFFHGENDGICKWNRGRSCYARGSLIHVFQGPVSSQPCIRLAVFALFLSLVRPSIHGVAGGACSLVLSSSSWGPSSPEPPSTTQASGSSWAADSYSASESQSPPRPAPSTSSKLRTRLFVVLRRGTATRSGSLDRSLLVVRSVEDSTNGAIPRGSCPFGFKCSFPPSSAPSFGLFRSLPGGYMSTPNERRQLRCSQSGMASAIGNPSGCSFNLRSTRSI